MRARLVARAAPLVRRLARWWDLVRSGERQRPEEPYYGEWREWYRRDQRHKRRLRGLRRLGWRAPSRDAWNLPR